MIDEGIGFAIRSPRTGRPCWARGSKRHPLLPTRNQLRSRCWCRPARRGCENRSARPATPCIAEEGLVRAQRGRGSLSGRRVPYRHVSRSCSDAARSRIWVATTVAELRFANGLGTEAGSNCDVQTALHIVMLTSVLHNGSPSANANPSMTPSDEIVNSLRERCGTV